MCKFESWPILILTIVDEKQTNDNSTQVEFEREIGWVFFNGQPFQKSESNIQIILGAWLWNTKIKKLNKKTKQQKWTSSTPRTEKQSTGVNRNKIEKKSDEKAGGSP